MSYKFIDTVKIIDLTGQDLVAFRRNVYLTIQSSLDYQEAAHKLLKNELKPGTEVLINLIKNFFFFNLNFSVNYVI